MITGKIKKGIVKNEEEKVYPIIKEWDNRNKFCYNRDSSETPISHYLALFTSCDQAVVIYIFPDNTDKTRHIGEVCHLRESSFLNFNDSITLSNYK